MQGITRCAHCLKKPLAAIGSRSLLQFPRSCSGPSKRTHPAAWAIFRQMDRDDDYTVSRAEILEMCRRFDASEHAEVVSQMMGSDEVSFETFCKNFKAVQMVRKAARLKSWHRCYGLGVAGNVAGHMEQAGVIDDKADDKKKDKPTPANVFTFYAPHPQSIDAPIKDVLDRLREFPVTNATIQYPKLKGSGNVQVEPEMGLYADIVYTADGKKVERLVPRRIAAFNDCSIRKLDGSEKLSEKKNWGFASKGMSMRSFRIDSLSRGTLVDRLVLCSYVLRDGIVHKYSEDAMAHEYLMFYDELLDWIVDRLNHQKAEGLWEEILPQLMASDYPTSMWIALGAGTYTPWGASNFLLPEDEVVVAIYDKSLHPDGLSKKLVRSFMRDADESEGIVYLHQSFVQ